LPRIWGSGRATGRAPGRQQGWAEQGWRQEVGQGGDDVGRRAGSESERDGAGHEGCRGDDGDDRAPTSPVETAAPVPAQAPVRAPAASWRAALSGSLATRWTV